MLSQNKSVASAGLSRACCARTIVATAWRFPSNIRRQPLQTPSTNKASTPLQPLLTEPLPLMAPLPLPPVPPWTTPHAPPPHGGRCELWEVKGKGRSMLAAGRGFDSGEGVISEQPVVIGRCCTDRCPGCTRVSTARAALAGGPHSAQCRWAAAESFPQLEKAIQWHQAMSARIQDVSPEQRSNHIRVICLLAMTIQAAADADLQAWLLTALRPATEEIDPQNPLETNTRGR